ncbi:MAG: response regulator [Chthoniobacterales bacterium]|nr:response regulator [Chthoniobacterales bacterium]
MLGQHNTFGAARVGSLGASAVTAGIGIVVLAGWAFDIPGLRRFVSGFVSMNPVTACCLVAAGVSLALLRNPDIGEHRRVLGKFLAAFVALVGAAKLVAIATHSALPVDQWLFTAQLGVATEPHSRMALRAAASLVLAGSALLLLDFQTRRGRRPAEFLATIVAIIAALALFAYCYGLFVYYKTPDFVPMSFPGSIAFLSLAAGILLARPDRGAMAFVTSDTTGGFLARLLLPLGLLLPILLGALRIGGENAGWYSTRIGVGLFATGFIVLFLSTVWWTARLLFRSDSERKQAEEHVRQVNAELEQRVSDRTAELSQVNEELRQASHAKDDFLAALSHELRTPLTPVLMCAAAMERDTTIDPEQREQLAMMRRNVELEARLIDDLLDLTRIARGKLELQRSAADIHSLLTHTEQIIRSDARGKGVAVHFILDAHEQMVLGDAARLHQVFWNVLKNAIKFTPAGGQITVSASNPAPGRIRIAVRDNGVGIEPTFLPSIFGAFVQGDRKTGGATSGLGLGMSISKTIVELHGGTIRADSDGLGKGATFTVELQTDNSLPFAVSQAAGDVETHPIHRLLVVEDHQPTLDVLARLLRKQGHQVDTASSVEAALALAATHVFDLVISDIGLPDGNGVDLMIQLTRDYGLRGIALSGYGMDEDIARTKNAGFLAHLVKPIDFERLNRVIDQVGQAA